MNEHIVVVFFFVFSHDLRHIMLRITAQSEIVAIEDIQHMYHMIKPNMLHIYFECSSN